MRELITGRPRTWRSPIALPFNSPGEMWSTIGCWALAAALTLAGFVILHAAP